MRSRCLLKQQVFVEDLLIYGIEMNRYRLCDVMEILYIERYQPSDNEIAEILRIFSMDELVQLSVDFLNGIGNKHNVKGKVVLSIAGIGDFYRHAKLLTNKQKFYLFHNILNNWDQLSMISRIQMNL